MPMPSSIDVSNARTSNLEDEEKLLSEGCRSSEDTDSTVPMLPKRLVRNKRKSSWMGMRSPLMFILDLFLLVAVLMLATKQYALDLPQLLGDVTGFVPAFQQEVVVFKAYPQFVSNHSSIESLQEAREHWMNNRIPGGQGFLKVTEKNLKDYALPSPITYKGSQSVGSSMMHALHCLFEIMAEYDMLALGIKKPPIDNWHMDHCFDYVRQMLLCGGDMALAGQDLPNGSSNLNVPHMCKKFDDMYQYLDSHRDNDDWQFGTKANHYLPP